MDIMLTSSVATIIHALSPLLGVGAGVAAAAAASAGAAGVAALSCASTAGAANMNAPQSAIRVTSFLMAFPLQRFRAGFAGADADDLQQVEDEDLSVADLPGVGGLLDRLDGPLEEIVADGGFDLDLRQEVD